MDTNIISLFLWAPFVLVGFLATLAYCIYGLCKGLKPSLVAMGSIVAATLLDLLFARLLAGMVAPRLLKNLPPDLFDGLGFFSGMVQVLLVSIISTLTAMLLFMLLLLILSLVITAIGNTILRKKTTSEPLTGSSRAVGAVLGMSSAILFTLIFLLPFYGTLAAYTPVTRSALDMIPVMSDTAPYSPQPLSAEATPMNKETPATGDDLQILVDILDCILQHPLVELSATAPVQSIYTSLSQVNTEQAPMNLSSMADTIHTLMEKISAAAQSDDRYHADAWQDVIVFCKEEVLPENWAYTTYVMALTGASDLFVEDPFANEILDIMTLDGEEFTSNAYAILDFAEAVLNQNALQTLESGDLAAWADSGLITEAVQLLNATQQMAQLKNLLYRTALESVIPEKAQQIRAYVEKYPLDWLTDPAQQSQEAEAFCTLTKAEEIWDLVEFFLCHPSLGQNALLDFAEVALSQNALEIGDLAAWANSERITEAVQLLNATQQTVQLKNQLYRTALESVIPEKAKQVRAFTEKYPLDWLTDPAQQSQEAEAFCILAEAKKAADLAEFFLCHPSLGKNVLLDLVTLLGITA